MSGNILSLKTLKMNYQVSGDEFASNYFKIFEANLKSGAKNIAISSTHYHSLEQKFIISTLHYFNQNYPHLKIATVSFSFNSGQFEEFSAHSTRAEVGEIFHFGSHFDLISWKYLIEEKKEQEISQSYDLILWELPEVEKIAFLYEKSQMNLDQINALYIISNRRSEATDVDFEKSTGNYFLKHGVKISHILNTELVEDESALKKVVKSFTDVFKKAS